MNQEAMYMATRLIAGKQVQFNDEGYMTDPAEWDKNIAAEIAEEEGLSELTEAHWKVIDFCREAAMGLGGKSPTLRQIPPQVVDRAQRGGVQLIRSRLDAHPLMYEFSGDVAQVAFTVPCS